MGFVVVPSVRQAILCPYSTQTELNQHTYTLLGFVNLCRQLRTAQPDKTCCQSCMGMNSSQQPRCMAFELPKRRRGNQQRRRVVGIGSEAFKRGLFIIVLARL